MKEAKDTRCRETLKSLALAYGLDVTDSQAALCCRHLELLEFWNRRVNLTRLTGLEAVVKHVLDSLIPRPWLTLSGLVLDVGSGAGFPGIPLAVTNPRLHVYLLDSDRKKTSFLKVCVAELGLKNVTVIQGRVEHAPWIPGGFHGPSAHDLSIPADEELRRFDLITVRAVRMDEALLHCLGGFLKMEGMVAYWAGKTPSAEVSQNLGLKAGFKENTADRKARLVLKRLPDMKYLLPGLEEPRRLLRWRLQES
ncbi:MAG: 16S rRNA (guanine(527)-N(7))-methyltransferase RsmG [Desulfosoma sp.]